MREDNSSGPSSESAAVAHLVALGYEDPLELAEREAVHRQRQRTQIDAAEAELKQGVTERAVDALEALSLEAPEWSAPRHLLARAYARMGRSAAATEQLDWLECHGVEHAELALLRAQLALRVRWFDAAREHAEYAQALQRPLAAADLAIGEIEFRRGNLTAAEAAFHRAIAVPAPHAVAKAALAAIALRRGDYAEAIDWSLQALEEKPRLAAAHYRLGLALYKLQRLPEATAALEAAATLNPKLAGPFRWLVQIAAKQGDDARVERYRRRGDEVVAMRRSRCDM